ncbi:STAS domain-containing protein [Actinoplanes derwentensis]|uniref:Anti-sigma factor antagonist n=1 Tax=Actinoplanes derwentensis TaxID=113562 RepID=A0A1H2CGW2_9ACTN|nr:STAS domain-containing protein [Actinoplanes derwentensis]GID88736.1 anti-sigma-B factor antagonist [Actinoplanes derwentensis]SDT69681.1 anti-sigma B factor antagonist [Actinoplanes derwentensis]
MTDETRTTTLELTGEIDISTVESVRVTLQEAVAARPHRIVVNMAGVSFIDSTGLGALIAGFQRARDNHISFLLAEPSAQVRQILVLSGLLEVVPITP